MPEESSVEFFKKRENFEVLFLTLMVHGAVFSFMVLTRVFGSRKGFGGLEGLLGVTFLHWDAKNYLHIAKVGYEIDWQIVFYPFYPLLISIVTPLVRFGVIAALLVSLGAHVLGSLVFYRLMRLDFSESFAKLALLFFLIFPTALYSVVPYTESTFLLFVFLSLYLFRKEHFVMAGACGLVAMLTRPVGIVLIPTLAAEYFFTMRSRIPWKKVIFPILSPLLGLGMIFFLNFLHHGNPLYFFEQMDKGWDKRLTFPQFGFLKAVSIFFQLGYPHALTRGLIEALGGFLTWIAVAYAFSRLRMSYAFYALASSFLITCQSVWESSLRYAFAVFPLYFLMADLCKKFPWLRIPLVASSLVFLALLSQLYAKGAWVQ